MTAAPPTELLPRRNPRVSASRILSPEAQESLGQLRGDDDATRWQIGDWAILEIERAAGQKRPEVDAATGELTGRQLRTTKAEVRLAVADAAGITPASVRQYEGVARVFRGEAREKYDGVLTWTHHRLAIRFRDPEAARRRCVESADEYGGQPASPRVMEAWLAAERPDKPPVDPDKHAAKARALLDEALDAAGDAPAYKAKCKTWAAAVSLLLEA